MPPLSGSNGVLHVASLRRDRKSDVRTRPGDRFDPVGNSPQAVRWATIPPLRRLRGFGARVSSTRRSTQGPRSSHFDQICCKRSANSAYNGRKSQRTQCPSACRTGRPRPHRSTYVRQLQSSDPPALEPLLEAARSCSGGGCSTWLLDLAWLPPHPGRRAQVTGVGALPRRCPGPCGARPRSTFRSRRCRGAPFADRAFDTLTGNFRHGPFPMPEAALAECVRVLVRVAPGLQLVGTSRRIARARPVPRSDCRVRAFPALSVPRGHDRSGIGSEQFAACSRCGAADVAWSAPNQRLMPDVDTLWRAGIGGIAVTAVQLRRGRSPRRLGARGDRPHKRPPEPRGLDPDSLLLWLGQKV